jgi:predicted nucleic acid-binding protein
VRRPTFYLQEGKAHRAGGGRITSVCVTSHVTKSTAASRDLNKVLSRFQSTTVFTLVSEGSNLADLWRLVRLIGEKSAIWPPDSVHLAHALQSGCSMFVSDDHKLLDKIDHCRHRLIVPYRREEFSFVTLPRFKALSVVRTPTTRSGRSAERAAALKALAAIGFK